jgi:hypothetical protein
MPEFKRRPNPLQPLRLRGQLASLVPQVPQVDL